MCFDGANMQIVHLYHMFRLCLYVDLGFIAGHCRRLKKSTSHIIMTSLAHWQVLVYIELSVTLVA